MKIALTGASGVVGSAVLRALIAAGHHVLVLSRAPSSFGSAPNLSVASCDLTDISRAAAHEVEVFAPDIFIHAGWHGTENSQRNHPDMLAINQKATGRLLEIAASSGCSRWIEFGSQAEYSPNLQEDIGEDAPQHPDTAYGAAKRTLCDQGQNFCARAGLAFTWLRLFTCYGREYKPGYIIRYLIDTLKAGEMPVLRTPHAVWDCLHAEDAARGVLNVIAHPSPNGIYNLAYGEGVSVGDMALMVARHVHFHATERLREEIAENPAPATRRVASRQLFSRHFAWEPIIPIHEGLRRLL